ncbi:MAG: replication initiation protein [Spirosomataceae bacterium]
MENKKKNKTIRLIRKSNDLVEGKYRFDIWEMRVFTKMLTLIHKDDEEFKEYRIFLKDIINDFGIENDKNAYRFIKQGAEKLTKKEIRIVRDTEEGEKEFLTHIAVGMDSFTNLSEGRYIDMSFHPKMKPFLLQLQTQFLMYDIQNILKLQSSFSVRIYELLKQYEPIGKRRITIGELKEMLDVVDKYKLYGHFKDRVILKAQEDLAAFTDIRFTFEEEKKGRSVYAIIFYIELNREVTKERQNSTLEVIKQLIAVETPAEVEIYDLIKDFKGVNKNTIKDWLKQFSSEHIIQRITLVKNQITLGSKVRNPMGYLQKIMMQANLFDPVEEVKQNQKQTVDYQQRIKEQIDKLVKELEQWQIDHYETQTQQINQLLAEDNQLREEIYHLVRNNNFYDHQLSIDQNLKKGMIQGMVFSRVKQLRYEMFEETDKKFESQEKVLKNQLRVLGWDG